MAKKPTNAAPVIEHDPVIIALREKQAKLEADGRVVRERINYLAGELSENFNIEGAAAALLAEQKLPAVDTARHVALESELKQAELHIQAIDRACELYDEQIQKARAEAANRLGDQFTRSTVLPLARELGERYDAMIQSAKALRESINDGQAQRLSIGYGTITFLDTQRAMDDLWFKLRKANPETAD